MKKFLVLIVFAVFLLSACAAETPTAVVSTAVVFAMPDTSVATPAVGSVTVQKLAGGMQALLLRSQPDRKSTVAGTVLPGATGKIIGHDASGTWLLLEFKEHSGWAPIEVLSFTIAQ